MDDSDVLAHEPEDREHFHRGAAIYKEGDPANHMYVVLQGEVEIGVDDAKETIGRGAIFGELGLLEGAPRIGFATALTEVHLLAIDEEQFAESVRAQPMFAIKFARSVLEQARRANSVFRRSH